MPNEISPKSVAKLRKSAKSLVRSDKSLKHAKALEHVAREAGFSNWKAVLKAEQNFSASQAKSSSLSLKFIESEDISLSDDDQYLLGSERKDDLDSSHKLIVSSNRAFLARKGIDYSIFEPTKTGLKKFILDATQQVRTYFELFDFHFFGNQGQGPEHKVIKEAFFIDEASFIPSTMSLYRPLTKQGDPRMWFRGLSKYAAPEDQVAIVLLDNIPHLLNLSVLNLENSYESNDSVGQFIQKCVQEANTVVDELLAKLRTIAKSPLLAIKHGDTAVGMSVEHALGIPANSSKNPDYKGIELKSGRGGKCRSNLFAQVAEWKKSSCKSSREILEKYGYERDGDYKLYCTINTLKKNPQGLIFEYVEDKDELVEIDKDNNPVATWTGEKLRARLKEKHTETFWIQADSVIINGLEHFKLKSVIHTKTPLLNQLMPLINSGVVTMDHLIKRTGDKNKVTEKGPLFKINKRDLYLLFPEPKKYSLF